MIEFLHEQPVIDRFGNCYGSDAPSHFELMEKINEIIEVVNNLQEHYDKERTAETIKDMSEDKEKYPTTSYLSGENAQIAYRRKYNESII